jgi:hypothetical protein
MLGMMPGSASELGKASSYLTVLRNVWLKLTACPFQLSGAKTLTKSMTLVA